MKLDAEPRLNGAPAIVIEWARKVAQVVNQGVDTDAATATQLATLATLITQAAPPGTVAFHAGSAPPAGWLKRNGAAVSRTTYAALFSAIGTTYGVGDGSTTFNLPEGRAEFIRGWDDGRGIDSGRVNGSAQGQMFEDHAHTNGLPWGSAGGSIGMVLSGSANNNGTGNTATASSGTRGTETRPRNVAHLPIIKY